MLDVKTTVDMPESTVPTRTCPSCQGSRREFVLAAPDRYHGREEPYQLVRCSSCSLVWTENAPPPEQIGAHYGADYDRAIAQAGEPADHWRERCDELSRYKSGGSILDLGCSAGGFLSGLNGSWKLHGIEMSPTVAERARARCGADVFVGDILDAPFAAESFDAITCFHVFEHLYEPKRVLEKVAKWLKPGGVFYTMMPNIESAGARIFKSYWYALELPRHLSHFSPVSLRNLSTSVGLEVVSMTTDREVFIENSARYLIDAGLEKVGIHRVPLARAKAPSLAFKVVRKGFRLTVLPILTAFASLAGDGESIHAVLRKPVEPR